MLQCHNESGKWGENLTTGEFFVSLLLSLLSLLILLPVGTFFPLDSSLGCEENENASCKIKCRSLSLSSPLYPTG